MTLSSVTRYDPEELSRVGERAVVVGGSIAGLSAARVLAEGFEEVLVLERDPFPDGPAARDGAPQTSHPHALLEAGRATFEDLFPGFGEAVLGHGGLLVDSGRDMVYYDEGGFVADTDSRLPTYCASRPLFEHVVRQRLLDLPTVTLMGDHQFTGYRFDETRGRISGVTYRDDTGAVTTVESNLVVDATGRTSRTPSWLADNGFETPPVDEVEIGVSYGTVEIERPPGDRRILLVPPSPPRTRGGIFVPVEGGRWQVIVQGMHGEGVPSDRDKYVEVLDGLPVDEPAELASSQRWLSDGIDRYPYPSSRRNRYADLDAFPEGLVVTGDAIASFNPIHGQGMSVAAVEAVLLHHALVDGGLENVAPRFFDRAADVVDVAWKMSVGADFAFSETTGPRPRGVDITNWYMSRLLRRAHDDPILSETFRRVLRLEQPARSLLRPGTVARVFRPTWDGTWMWPFASPAEH